MICRKLEQTLLMSIIILLLSFSANTASAQSVPQPHGADGTVYELDGITEVWRTVNFSILNNDTGSYISGMTGIGNSPGKYSVSINADDGDVIILTVWNKEHSNNLSTVINGIIHNLSITLNMTVQNYEPEITSSPENQTNEDENYNYQVIAEDYNLDTLTYNLTQKPVNMTINELTGLITWNPKQSNLGVHQIKIFISDSSLNVTQNYSLEVLNVNDAPVITSFPSLSAKEREEYTYQLNVTDEDGDNITFSLVASSDGMNISANGFLNWTPTFGQNGQHTVTISASDGSLTDNQTFTITVADKNNSNPEITSSPSLQAYEEQEYTYNITATDEDNESLTYELIVAPNNMTLSGSSISWNISQQDVYNSTAQVTIMIRDERNGTASQTFYLQLIDVNDPPTITSSPVETATTGELYIYSVIVEDPDDNSFNFGLDEYPENLRVNLLSGVIKWIPQETETGIYTVTVTASDGEYTATQTYSMRVIAERPGSIVNKGMMSSLNERTINVLFDNTNVSIKEIIVVFKNIPERDSIVTIQELKTKPKNIGALPLKVFKYLEIISDINETEDFNATIEFSVTKEFVEITNSTKEEIVLMHYDGTWKELNTIFKNNNSEEYFFEAVTNKFSYFAIATKKEITPAYVTVPTPINLSGIFEIQGIVYRSNQKQQAPINIPILIMNLNTTISYQVYTGTGPYTGGFSTIIEGTKGDLIKVVVNYKSGTSEELFLLEKDMNIVIHTDIPPEKLFFGEISEEQAIFLFKVIILTSLVLIIYPLLKKKE